MSDKKALVILAAGMGSRYGGVKQLDSITKYDNQIIDFSIYDAIDVGFKKLYLVIQEKHKSLFDEKLVNFIKDKIEVEYVYQSVPQYLIDKGREKPLGTAHALYCCKDIVKEDFMLLNADDYYGKSAFKTIFDYLNNDNSNDGAIVAYHLKNTLSKNGTVSRGVCFLNKNNQLEKIREVLDINYINNTFKYSLKNEFDINLDTLVSMNCWGFKKSIFNELDKFINNFLDVEINENIIKKEALLPEFIQKLIDDKKLNINVFTSDDKWIGITYKQDKEEAVNNFNKLIEKGEYKENLWDK